MHEQARTKLVKARIALIMEHVFFGTLALRLQLVEDPKCRTLWVDGKNIGYNPEFVMKLSDSLCKSAMAHEVGHCIWEHIKRRGDRNAKKWNYAGDYVINSMLKEAGFEIGDGWLYDPQYHNMTADHVYNLMPDLPDGDGSGDGSLCDIRQEKEPAPGQVDEWKVATAMAANAARIAGKLPGGLERFIKDILYPKTDWRTVMMRWFTEDTKSDYSWMRPNKRYLHLGYYLPTLYSPGMGVAVVAIDTSGSIDQKMLDVFGGAVQAMRDATRPRKTVVIYCDTEINHVEEFAADDELNLKICGGGGTDFCPPFAYVEDQGLQPAAFLYLTDLYGPMPKEAPDYPVLWCCINDKQPAWGEVVEIEV